MKESKGMSAWLITWDCSGNHAKPRDRVVEILDPRLSSERVRQIVELLYHKDAPLSEKVDWRLRRRQQPYPAESPSFHGVKWEGEINCGHNPWLRARLVDNLIIGTDENGRERASWTDGHSPREMAEKTRRLTPFTEWVKGRQKRRTSWPSMDPARRPGFRAHLTLPVPKVAN